MADISMQPSENRLSSKVNMDYSPMKLMPSKRLKLSTNFELCVICTKAALALIPLTSCKNQASVQLGMEESEERAAETTNIISNTESSGRPAIRMSLHAIVNWELCLFCQQASYKKNRKLYNVATYDVCTKFKAAAERQQDQRILTIVSHDEFVLIPYEGKYHKGCHSKYLKAQKKESGDGGQVSEYDSAFYKLIEEIDSKLQIWQSIGYELSKHNISDFLNGFGY